MLADRSFSNDEVKSMYEGERKVVKAIKKSAGLIMFANSEARLLYVF